MTLHLAVLDWILVAAFLALILWLGFSSRSKDLSLLQFLVAGRKLTSPAFVATLVSTWYGGILGVGESASYYGFGTWLLLGVPYYVFALIYAIWLAPKVRGADQISIPERFEAKWGRTSALLAAGLLFLLAVPAAHVLMLGVLLKSVTGLNLTVAVIVATFGGTLFLYRGGLLADVRVSFLAFVMMYAGFAAMLGYCLVNFPPSQALKSLEPPMKTFTGGQGWVVIVSFFLLGAWTLVDPGFHQRVAATESASVARRGLFVSIACWFVFDMLSMGVALYALARMGPLPADKLAIYPMFAQMALPAGLKGLFFCGMLGTILSAMVGYTLISGATIGRDIVGRLVRPNSEATVKNWTRAGMALACVVAVGLGLAVDSVVNLWYAWGGVVTGCLLLPLVIAYLGKSSGVTAPGINVSISVSFVSVLSWMIWCGVSGNSSYQVFFLKLGGSWRLLLAQPDQAMARKAADSFTLDVGTLVPGLVISAIVMCAALVARRRNGNDRSRPNP